MGIQIPQASPNLHAYPVSSKRFIFILTNAREEEQVCHSPGKRAVQWEPHWCPEGFQLAPPEHQGPVEFPRRDSYEMGAGTKLSWFRTAQTVSGAHLKQLLAKEPSSHSVKPGDTQAVSPGRGYSRSWLRTRSWLVVPHHMSGRRDRGNIHCASADSATSSQKQRWFELTWLDLQWGELRTPIRPLLPALVGI